MSRFDRIFISIYGLDASEYRQITRRHTYEQCISSIKRIVEFSKPGTVCFGFRLIYSRNPDEIMNLDPENSFGRISPSVILWEDRTWGALIGSRLNELPGDARWKDMPPVTTPCFRPFITIKVCVNGDLSLCCCSDKTADDLNLGSIRDKSIERSRIILKNANDFGVREKIFRIPAVTVPHINRWNLSIRYGLRNLSIILVVSPIITNLIAFGSIGSV